MVKLEQKQNNRSNSATHERVLYSFLTTEFRMVHQVN